MHLDLTRTDNIVLKQFEGSSSKHYYNKDGYSIQSFLTLSQNLGTCYFLKTRKVAKPVP